MDHLSEELRRIASMIEPNLEPPDDSEEDAYMHDLDELERSAMNSHEKAIEYFDKVGDHIEEKNPEVRWSEDEGQFVGVSPEFLHAAPSVALHWFSKEPKWAMSNIHILPVLVDVDREFKQDLTSAALDFSNEKLLIEALVFLHQHDLLHRKFVEDDARQPEAANADALHSFLLKYHG